MSDVSTIGNGDIGSAEAQSGSGRKQGATGQAAPASYLSKVFLDGRGRLSRPKLLFAVAMVDAVLVVALGFATFWGGDAAGAAVISPVIVMAVGFAAVLLLRWNWSYSVAALQRRTGQLTKVAGAVAALVIGLAGSAHLLGLEALTAERIGLWMALVLIALSGVRLGVEQLMRVLASAGVLSRRTVIVGSGKDADELVSALMESEPGQVDVLGYFDDRTDERSSGLAGNLTKLGSFEQLAAFCQDDEVDLVLVSVPLRAEERLLQILQELFSIRVDIRISALNAKLRLNSSAYKYIGEVPVLAVMDKPLNDWDRAIKNVEDRVLALLILCLAAPVMALVALAVRLDSKGPILFKQRRYGFNNQLVEVYKFRSMYADQSDANAAKLVSKGDPRVTRVGRIIRKTSLDELPQLFNVLSGEMSLVGPRPHATQAKAGTSLYQDVVQGYLARHRVKPGITGWAQICGWRGETDTQEKIRRRVECDMYYIDNWSVRLDLYIIVMTPFVLLSGKNAY